jgi:hypothetical protein
VFAVTIIGIDADVHRVAWAAVRNGCVSAVATIERANSRGRVSEDYDHRLTVLMRKAQDLGAVVYLEDIWLAEDRETSPERNVQAFKALAQVQGEIKREARRCSVPVVDVSPNSWHSEVLGFTRGRERLKEAAMSLASALWATSLTEHEADAVCVGLYGERQELSVGGLEGAI